MVLSHYNEDLNETADVLYLHCFVQHLCIFAAFTLLVYEYSITLDKEIEFFWGRSLNGGSLLFFLSRYIPLLVRAMGISGYVVINELVVAVNRILGYCNELMMVPVSCYKFSVAFQAVDALQYLPCAIFSGMRTWVLSGRNRALTTFVVVLSLIPVGSAYYKVPSIEARVDPSFGCSLGLASATSSEEERVCIMTSDAIVLVVTWCATYHTGVLQRTSQWEYTSFLETLFRDGIIHFCALLVLNVLDLVFSLRMIRNPDLNSSFYLVVFIGPASTILVNRFLIHLQEVNKYMIQGFCPSGDVSMQSNDSSHELRFARTSPEDRPTVIITPDPHDDFVQLMDNTMSETTSEAHAHVYDTIAV